MSRRIRFTPWSCSRTFVRAGVVACSLLGAAEAADVPFSTPPPISTMTPIVQAIALADVDGDGDLDALSASVPDDKIAWHENLGPAGWALRTISLTADWALDVAAADIDGDGDTDALSTSLVDTKVAWYENASGDGSVWVTHTITQEAYGAVAVAAGDVDGDGDLDVLATEASASAVTWYENTLGNGSAWTTRTITTAAPNATSVDTSDVDGDGDLDALSASQDDDKVAWYENTLGNGSAWTTRTISISADMASNVVAADVDGDGDTDAMASTAYSLAWYENTAGNGSSWVARTMAPFGASVLAAGDIDGDGDVDALTASGSSLQLVWLENASGNGASWTVRTVATVGYGLFSVALGDLDGDGDPDLVSAEANDGEINWYRNESIHQTACFGPVRTIFAMDNPFGASAADVDRDGDLDVFATSFIANSNVTWHRSDAGTTAWTPFTVATNRPTFFANVADVDGDGDPDAFIGSDASNAAAWVENQGGGSGWPIHPIGTPGDFSSTVLVGADIDGDGDTDALAPPYNSNLSWRENLDGQGLLWLLHTVANVTNGTGARAVDLDRDGDLDIVVEEVDNLGGPNPFTWYENVTGDGSTWSPHTIARNGVFDAVALDLDSDGDLDLVSSDLFGLGGVAWHENLSGNGTSWAMHTLSTLGEFTSIESQDVDRDGDQDLVGSGGSLGVVWLERTGPGVSFTARVVEPNAGTPGQVGTADLDGNAAPDLLWASQLGDAVRWNRNELGQVVLDLVDQVPSTVVNGDVFSILRLTVTHGGRMGDSDLELARLELLFEEDLGDPLTSAEANALVEELRIYRDVNGNGTFDPGLDLLVANVPRIELASGVQTVTFTDGDPSVQVAFGTPVTFFVVAQLTADASQQVPHQFRLTHLAAGPSATVAEDRNADIPLTIACPADFASRMIVATPVELTGFTVE